MEDPLEVALHLLPIRRHLARAMMLLPNPPQPDLVTGFSEQASHKRVPFLLFPFCVNLKYPLCVISTPGPFDFPEIIT